MQGLDPEGLERAAPFQPGGPSDGFGPSPARTGPAPPSLSEAAPSSQNGELLHAQDVTIQAGPRQALPPPDLRDGHTGWAVRPSPISHTNGLERHNAAISQLARQTNPLREKERHELIASSQPRQAASRGEQLAANVRQCAGEHGAGRPAPGLEAPPLFLSNLANAHLDPPRREPS